MAKLPNKNFISYLGNYGLDSNLQFDEFVDKAARALEITPFEFELPRQNDYRAAIKRVIDNHHSTVILLSGRAGDGKTHFLRKLFTSHDFIGHTITEWEKAPNCFNVTKDTPLGSVNFTLVKDFTSNDSAKVTAQLRATIVEIMEQNMAIASSLALPAEATLADRIHRKQQSETIATPTCNIVLIAGNNGKIMERFQSFFADQQQNLGALGRFIKALELYMLEHDSSRLDTMLGVQCHDMSACLGAAEIKQIFDAIMEAPQWQGCDGCDHLEYCPILRNRKILMQPLVILRLLQLHELIVDNGQHFTVRNVLLLLVNALLGCNTKDKALTCEKVNYNVSRFHLKSYVGDQPRLDRALMESNLASLPFDNIFGLNASARRFVSNEAGGRKRKNAATAQESASPIFADLNSIGVGQFSTKLIDELILAGNSESASQVLRQQYHELLEQNDHYALTSSLQHYSDLLQQSSVDANDAEKDDELQAALNAMRDHLYSLRRLLFFVVADPQHDDLQSLLQTSALTRLTATGSTGATGATVTATDSNTAMGHGAVAPNNSQAGAGAVNDFDDFSGFDDPFADPSADPFVTDDLSFMEHGSTINGGLGYGGLFDSDYSSMNYDLSLDQDQAQDGHQTQGPAPFFAPYLLTGYPFALQYLALKHEVLQQAAPMLAALAQQGAQGYHGSLTNYSCPVAIRRCLEIAKTLIVGLNRAFTNLMLMKGTANTLYITTSNKLNPTAPSIIYDTQRFCVPVDYSGSKADTSIRFERSPSNMMELVFHQNLSASLSWGAGGNGGMVSGQPMFKSSRMLITPKLFEYLMALASGKVGLSFSSECNNDLIAFKASIDSMIMESTPLVQPSNDSQNMLNSVFICKLDPSGGFNWN